MSSEMFLLVTITLAFSVTVSYGQEQICGCSPEFIATTGERISQLESMLASLPVHLNTLMIKVSEGLDEMLQVQNVQVEKLRAEIDVSKNNAIEQFATLVTAQLNATGQALEHMKEEMKEQAEKMETAIQEQQERIEAIEKKLEEKEEEEEEKEEEEPEEKDKDAVAFFVTDHYDNVYDPPLFSKTVTNVGDAYDVDSGIFTCPVPGIYLFTFSVQTIAFANTHCQIAVNGDIVAYGQTSAQYADMGSISAFLKLSVGDEVTLTECEAWRNAYSSEGTTFGGALIHTIPEDKKR